MMSVSGPMDLMATYRLQLGPDLPFQRVRELLPYFRDLGISHLYLSPCFKAAGGSTHGYDVADPSEVNPQLGGQTGLESLWRASDEVGIGLVLDVVPNHMAAAGRQNRWWWDVLANGRSSVHAGFFDIDWDHPNPLLRGKILLPILGDEIERCLEARQIQLRRRGEEIVLGYFEHELPLCARSLSDLTQSTGLDGHPHEWDAAVGAINADRFRIEHLLDLQHYRLAFWRRANRELNYRRFFDIHQLVGVCVEKEEVFAASHALVLRWVKEGRIAGLRIDHPDGLRDPTAYLMRLRAAAPRAWVVVEKILEPGEPLASVWPVAGTTGYDFLNLVNGVFVDPAGEGSLTDFYREFTGQPAGYDDVVHAKKLLVLEHLFSSEMSRIERLLEDSRRNSGIDVCPAEDVRRALTEVIVCYPVYRTYIQPETGSVAVRDQAVVQEAANAARIRRPEIAPDAWRLITDLLLLKHTGPAEREFVWRFQQLTGPVMAKGVEDTAFYCFNRLIGLNEVGGNPGAFGVSLHDFHAFCARMKSNWPQTLLASATHDTKRGEDTRVRIGLLSEIPELWIAAVRRWSRMNARFRRKGFPDRNTEYFLYQTLAGAWPIGCDRLVPAMLKAAKEAKAHTSWTDPEPVFEEALQEFVKGVLGHAEFTADLAAFLQPLAWPAVVTSLSQALIKCTAPGVPDIYQGTELWDLNLVDPDNRRPVDFDRRRRLLAEIGTLSPGEILRRHEEGLPKLFLLQRTLSTRRRHAAAFGPKGDYLPLAAEGERAGHLLAFVRGGQAVTLAPRMAVGLNGGWKGTTFKLPTGDWEDAFSGIRFTAGTHPLARVTAQFPVALLVRQGGSP